MSKINGIFAATMSILNDDLSLNVEKTIKHAENLIDQGCHGTLGKDKISPDKIFDKLKKILI